MSSNKNEHIIMRIKALLATNKTLTQKALASHLQRAPSTISQWFRQNRDIPADCIIPICEFFDCSISWLLTGNENDTVYCQKANNQEQKLLDFYRQADERGKRNIMRQAEAEISELPSSGSKTG